MVVLDGGGRGGGRRGRGHGACALGWQYDQGRAADDRKHASRCASASCGRPMMRVRMRMCYALGALLIASCQKTNTVVAPTEVLLRVNNTDDVLRANMTGLRVTLAVQEGAAWVARPPLELKSKNLKWPVDIPITPSAATSVGKQLELVVDALAGQSVLAQTRARVNFVKNERRLLDVY